MKKEIEDRVTKWLDENVNPYGMPKMVWLDIETTGLDLDNDMMIEIGLLVTDAYGFVVPNGRFESIIFQPTGIDWANAVDPFVVKMHETSHLMQELEEGDASIHNIGDVEEAIVDFLLGHFGVGMKELRLPLSGSSVHFDAGWLKKRMPRVSALFSHRIIDVSSDDEKAKAKGQPLFLETPGAWRTMQAHRVVPDMIDSIEAYRFYNN